MKAYIFPGQGAQFEGMGQELYNSNEQAKQLFEQANDLLGFKITDIRKLVLKFLRHCWGQEPNIKGKLFLTLISLKVSVLLI